MPLECLEPSPLPFLSHNPVEHIVGKLHIDNFVVAGGGAV